MRFETFSTIWEQGGDYAPFDAMPQMLAESHNVDEDTHFAKRRIATKE